MPSPLVHAILPPSCLLSSKSLKVSGPKLALVYVILANLPDLDVIPALIFSDHYREIHRAWGHNIFSLVIFAVLGAYVLRRFISPEFTGRRGYLVSGFLVGSHVILDALGHFNSFGFYPTVPLLWPLSKWQFTIPVKVFHTGSHLGEIIPTLGMLVAWAVIKEVWEKRSERSRQSESGVLAGNR